MPIIKKQKANVIAAIISKKAPEKSLHEYGEDRQEKLVIVPIGAKLNSDPLGFSVYRQEDINDRHSYDQQLYEDIKKYHFQKQEIIARWEQFLGKFESYNERCLDIAEGIATEIKTKSGLPISSIEGADPDRRVAHIWLAEYIFLWALGLEWRPLGKSRGNGNRVILITEGRKSLACAKGEEIDVVFTIADECKKRSRSELDSLTSLTKELEKEASSLIEDLDRLLQSPQLTGKCAYCKV